MPHSDIDDLARWRTDRDPQAFQQIIDSYTGLVFGVGRRITGNVQDAEDITQKCFLKLAERPPFVKYSLGAWLHRVATNLAINEVRKEQSRTAREETYQAHAPGSSEADWDELQGIIDEAIDQLPDKFKEPLIARYFDGQTYQAISKEMGISRQTVAYRTDRGVEQIRKVLRRKGHVVGTAALASMFKALRAEPVSAALAQALSNLELSGIGTPAARQRASFRSLFENSAVGRKPIQWLTAIAVVIGAAAGFLWSSRPAEVQGEATSITSASMAERNHLDPVRELTTVASNDNQESFESSPSADATDAEAPLIQGLVVHSGSGTPIPNLRILVYPEAAVDFTIEEEKDLTQLGGTDGEIVETYKAALNLDSGDSELPWYMFSNRAHFEPDLNVEIAFATDEQGYFNAESLSPGKYLAIFESTEYSANGWVIFDHGEKGTAQINGYANIEIFEQAHPQAFIVQADPLADLNGRIYDTSTNRGVQGVTVLALRRASSFLSINEGSAITDASGAYQFEGLPIGAYTLVRDELASFHGDLTIGTVVHYAARNRVDFPLAKGTALSGTLYWGDVPAADTEFFLNYNDGSVAMGAKLVEHPIYTDASGRFFVAGLQSFTGILYGTVYVNDTNFVSSDWVQNLSLSEGEFKSVDLKFDIGTASVQGRFTQAGRPLRNATVIWYSGRVNGMQQRTTTDGDGNYRFETIPSGPAILNLYYPFSYAATARTIDVIDGEQLQIDVDASAISFTFSVNGLPRNMRNTWVFVFDADYEVPIGISAKEWIEQRRFKRLGLSRIFPKTPGILRGLTPGRYKFMVVASPSYGHYPHFVDDLDLVQSYLDRTVLLFMDFEVSLNTNTLVTIDYSEAKPLSDFFSVE